MVTHEDIYYGLVYLLTSMPKYKQKTRIEEKSVVGSVEGGVVIDRPCIVAIARAMCIKT